MTKALFTTAQVMASSWIGDRLQCNRYPAGHGGRMGVHVVVCAGDNNIEVVGDQIHTISGLIRLRSVFPTDRAIARVMDVHRSSIHAWWRGRTPNRENALLLSRVATVIRILEARIPAQTIRDWLSTPLTRLYERSPVEALRRIGLVAVLQAMNTIENQS